MNQSITEEMYLLAKKIVASYDKNLDENDPIKQNFTYTDMRTCFAAGVNRGCYIASLIKNEPIDFYPPWDEFISGQVKK